MPGTTTLNAPRYLPALVGSRQQGESLLASLAANSGLAETSVTPATALPQRAPDPNPPAADPAVQRDIAQFIRALATAKTPVQLLGNPVALRVLLTANGLADQAGNDALATRALLSNPSRSNSLLKQLRDTRWIAINRKYSFATNGLSAMKNPAVIAGIARAYAEALRVNQSDHRPAARRYSTEFAHRVVTLQIG